MDSGSAAARRARRRPLTGPGEAATVPAARLCWDGDQPRSVEFGDIYHAADGIAEVDRVFLAPNRFDRRALECSGWLRIGELGFGTGLNFVTAAERFLKLAPRSARLHFVSFEARPIDVDAFTRLAGRRAARQPLYAAVAAVYPPRLPGWHRRTLGDGRIRLSLYFGDAAEGLAEISGRQTPFDAWFLDGFAPDRNPELWSATLLGAIAGLSAPNTSVATFTAAGHVRRRLLDAGFSVTRLDQRPHKRHTLAGQFRRQTADQRIASRRTARRAVVVGAGLAGAFTARALAEADIDVTVIDAEAAPRVSDAVMHGRILADGSARARMRNNGYLGASSVYQALGCPITGALQFPSATIDSARLDRITAAFEASGNWLRRVDPASASALAGVPLRGAPVYFPDALRVPLAAVCARLLDDARIERLRARAEGWRATDHGGVLATDRGDFDTDDLVICTGVPPAWARLGHLEVLPVWGQFERARLPQGPCLPLLADGYLSPSDDGTLVVGSTYEQRPWPVDRASGFNRDRFEAVWQRLTGQPSRAEWTGAERGCRGVSSDRMPVVGRTDHGLIVNLAHGSSGTITAPMAADLTAELLGGEFAPLGRAEIALLDPGRFQVRQARRGPRHGAT